MTEKLIFSHNLVVGQSDEVYHLGDMFWHRFGLANAFYVMNLLHGKHYYVRGNHEELFSKHNELRSRFIWMKDMAELKLQGYPTIVLCHYALREWHGKGKGAWHLFGHSHGQLASDPTLSMDVGVDAVGYRPISIQEISWKMHSKMDWVDYVAKKKTTYGVPDLLAGDYW